MKAKIIAALLALSSSAAFAQAVSYPTLTAIDCSGTVTSANGVMTPIAAATVKHGFSIGNLDTTEALWWSPTGNATVAAIKSFPLPPGAPTTFVGAGFFVSPVNFPLGGAVTVTATTAGHKFSCFYW